MARFSYLAKNLSGTPKSGIVEAKDKQEIAKSLRQEGFILISAEAEKNKNFLKKINFGLFFLSGNKVPFTEKIMFSRNIKVIVSAGISLPKALSTLSEQTKSKNFKKILLAMAEEVNKGKSFSEALSRYPEVFNELFVSMAKVGEEAGTLEQSLDVITDQMEKSHDLKEKVKGAMIYPMVIISAMFVIGIVMLILVVPQLAKTFKELGIELPLTTKIVIFLGEFLAKFWYFLPVIFLVLIVAFRAFVKNPFGKKMMDNFLLKVPLLSSVVKKTNAAQSVRSLSALISAGVSLVRALEITSETLNNTNYKNAMLKASEEMKKGIKLSQFLLNYQNIYPPLVVQMLAVGEETGQMTEMLLKLAEFYEDEVSRTTKNLSTVIEPFLMIIVGILVGFFAISMMQPMYSMIQTI